MAVHSSGSSTKSFGFGSSTYPFRIYQITLLLGLMCVVVHLLQIMESHTCGDICFSRGCVFADGLAEVCVRSQRYSSCCPFYKRVVIPRMLYSHYANMAKIQVETFVGKIELPINYSSFSRAVVAMALSNPNAVCTCSFCNKKATNAFGYSSFDDLGDNRAKLTLKDDWLCCEDRKCQELAEFNSRRGCEIGVYNDDESAAFVLPRSSDSTDEILDIVSAIDPGYGVATDLAPNVCRIDYTTVEVFITETMQPIKVSIPYKKLASIDNTIKFPCDWSFDRAKAAGFVGLGEVSGDTVRKYMKDVLDGALSKVLNRDGGVTCSICNNNVALGYSFQLAYIPKYDGTKGIFRSTGKERWTCDSDICVGRAARRTFRRQVQMNQIVCHCCGSSDDGTFPRCSICKKVYYCSRECQKKDWNAHKPSCRAMVIAKESGN